MTIDHIAMYVDDLQANRDFFIRYFGAVSNDGYINAKTGFQSYFLSFEDGARLEIMTCPDIRHSMKSAKNSGYIHIAFHVGSAERVDYLTAALEKDGFLVLSGPRTTGDGYYESCIEVLEGNVIELTV